jgi:hypothetical protein
MLDRKAGKFPMGAVIIMLVAEQSREEGLRDCLFNVSELFTDTLLDSLYKLPLLLQRFLQARVGRLREVLGHHS